MSALSQPPFQKSAERVLDAIDFHESLFGSKEHRDTCLLMIRMAIKEAVLADRAHWQSKLRKIVGGREDALWPIIREMAFTFGEIEPQGPSLSQREEP